MYICFSENRFVISKESVLFYFYTFVVLILICFTMKIIIAGSGEVGFHLAKLLSFESQDIILIDVNRESLIHASNPFGYKSGKR